MMDNIFIRTDSAGNIKADKEKSTEKIDGAVATIMGLDRAIRNQHTYQTAGRGKTTPRNRDEQEIAGYRDVLNVIHENFNAIPISRNYILQLHKIMYSYMNNLIVGQTKNVQNYISATYPDGHTEILFTPLTPFETPEALDRICEEYNRVIGNMEVEPLIAIPVFIHDFLCIHPFNDGNGRMSRLLTTLLLYRNGFYVGKYISLEAKIAQAKDLYYDALSRSQDGMKAARIRFLSSNICLVSYWLHTRILKTDFSLLKPSCLLLTW